MTPEQLADLQARASRPRRTVPVVCNGDLAQKINGLQDELAELDRRELLDRRLGSRGGDARAEAINAQLDDLYEQAKADTLLVVLEGLEGTAWRALLGQYPPRKAGEGEEKPTGFDALCNRETMEEPLIRASVIGHKADVDDVEILPLPDDTLDWLLGFVNVEQRDTLFVAAWACNRVDDAVPLRRRPSTTQRSVAGSPPPAPGASPSAASTAGNRRKSTSTSTRKAS